jgi:hypothetical protein
MSDKRAGLRWLGLMALLLLGASLACNMPLAEETIVPDTRESNPKVVSTIRATSSREEATLGSPQTIPAALETRQAGEEGEETLPTFTPIKPPTLAATLTPSATPSRRPTSTPRPDVTASATAADAGGPLSFTYSISWRLKDESATTAIATVTIDAKGGSGVYTYYRDDLEVDGPVFEYEWATCSGNPGSLRVDSTDGQTARVEYFENPPCPTATPTATP